MRRLAPALVDSVSVALSGVVAASVFAGPGRSPSGSPANRSDREETSVESADSGVHGGPIERFHSTGSCGLTTVSALPGNWTHGD